LNSSVQTSAVPSGINLFRLGGVGGAIQRRLSPIRNAAEAEMIQACRYLAYAILFIGAILCLVAGLSFVVDIPGMTMNGRRVESHEDKIVFFWASIGFVSGALVSIAILRREVLQRNSFVWRAAYWADTLPSTNVRGRRVIVIGVAIVSAAAAVFSQTIEPSDRLAGVLGMPLVFALGFGGSALVLGVQVLNPFCPEPLLRAFALISLAFFGLGALVSIPQAFLYTGADAGALLMPSGTLGFAYGAALVLRRWSNFEPLLEPPAA
jgi:hypothetical protein